MDVIDVVAKDYARHEIGLDEVRTVFEEMYMRGFRRGAEIQKNIPYWIPTKDELPPQQEPVQLLIYDDSGDIPYVYVTAGIYYNGIYIVDNDIINCDVIGWQKLNVAPSLKECKNMR